MSEYRWIQRFENYERAFLLLRSALEDNPLSALSDLEKEGIVQRFEYTFELAWKTLRDYLEYAGVALDQATPRAVIKTAFAVGILDDGQTWITMLEQRNLMAHPYDRENFEKAMAGISGPYLAALDRLYGWLKQKSVEP